MPKTFCCDSLLRTHIDCVRASLSFVEAGDVCDHWNIIALSNGSARDFLKLCHPFDVSLNHGCGSL